jgi:hypothetical protein
MHGSRDEVVPLPPPFEIVLRGFDRQQVIDHVNALKARVASLGAERDAALQRAADLNENLERARRETAEATRQVDRFRRDAQEAATELDRLQRSPLAGATARIQRMLQMAEDESAELRGSARAEADRLLIETRQLCERLETESAGRRRTEEAESASSRQRAEQQTEHEIARRQAETHAWVTDYQTRSIAALYALMQIAGERLSNRVVKVKRQVTAAKALRSQVTDQLSAVQCLLAEALGVVEQPTPAEQAEQAEQAGQAEQDGRADQAEQVEQAEHVEQGQPVEAAKTSGDAPSPQPAAAPADPTLPLPADPTVPLRQDRVGRTGRPRRADQPTARFGLHP